MGLDMYLYASRYLSDYDKADKEKKANMLDNFPELNVYLTEDSNPINEVRAEVGYWRKANQIHAWFVDNVQDGIDECQESRVSREKLAELKGLCERVLSDNTLAEELLPSRSGFFFGQTEYDEYYMNDLSNTVAIIDGALRLPDNWSMSYRSSW